MPNFVSRPTVSGTSATRRSPAAVSVGTPMTMERPHIDRRGREDAAPDAKVGEKFYRFPSARSS
jgi:hypothetical protein